MFAWISVIVQYFAGFYPEVLDIERVTLPDRTPGATPINVP